MKEWYVTDKQGEEIDADDLAESLCPKHEVNTAWFAISTKGKFTLYYILNHDYLYFFHTHILNLNEYSIEYCKTDPTTLTKNLFKEPSVTDKKHPLNNRRNK